VFCASSLPVRHLEQYTPTLPNIARVFSSRGASGIDGTISSALGVAAALAAQNTEEVHHHVTLLIGDLAFYHDMNGLLALSRCNITNITIVLVNNDGGGIFQRLPVSQFDPPFTDLFLTPHGLDFEPAVRMYGLDYHRVKSLAMLREQVIHAVDGAKPAVIEVRTDSKRDLERREEINHAIQQMFQFEGKLKEI
jgi:2-succinyl-5-enolpyruvyl-6-hydroxy-3-cyclohexene-1-carboxylate synthase